MMTLKKIIALQKPTQVAMTLDLSEDPDITDNILIDKLQKNTSIKKLNLKGCTTITDKSIGIIGNYCKDLVKIDLSETNVRKQELEILAKSCQELTTIFLQDCPKITNDAVSTLVQNARNLTELDLNFCEKVEDNAIRKIAKFCRKLSLIDLSNTKCTIQGLESLIKRNKDLIVDIFYSKSSSKKNKITDDKVRGLQKQYPGALSDWFDGQESTSFQKN